MGTCLKHERTFEGAYCGHCRAEERIGYDVFVCTCGEASPALQSVRVFDSTTGKVVRRCADCGQQPPHAFGHVLWVPEGEGDAAFHAQYRFGPLPDGLQVAYCVQCDWALYSTGTVWRVMTWSRLAQLWERSVSAVGHDDRHGPSGRG